MIIFSKKKNGYIDCVVKEIRTEDVYRIHYGGRASGFYEPGIQLWCYGSRGFTSPGHCTSAPQESFFSTDLVILRSPISSQPVTILSLVSNYCQLKGMLITSDTMTLPPYLMKKGVGGGGGEERTFL